MSKCPNNYSKDWKDLVDEFGVRDAYRAFLMQDTIPTVDQARELLSDTIKAPNGKPSKLYQDMLNLPEVGGDKQKAIQLYKQTHSPEFKKWFGNSKVVDENGEPLLVYHGSGKEFEQFNRNKQGLIFFTSNKEYAQTYAQLKKEGIEFLNNAANRYLNERELHLFRLEESNNPNQWALEKHPTTDEDPELERTIEQYINSGYSPKEIIKKILIDGVQYDWERLYLSIAEGGDDPEPNWEGMEERDRIRSMSSEEQDEYFKQEAIRHKRLQKERQDNIDEVYRLLAKLDPSAQIISEIEHGGEYKKHLDYKEMQGQERLYPVFLRISNPQNIKDISNEAIDEGTIKISDNNDGIIGTDAQFYHRVGNKKVFYENQPIYAVKRSIQAKSAFNQGAFSKQSDNIYQQKQSSAKKPDTALDNKVKGFLKSIGVEVQRLANEGQDFAAMADTVNGIIGVVDGKADITTLGHEATHMFLDLLPADSRLLDDILRDVKNREEYDTVYDQYKGDGEYLNADGSVNEDKMAKEAAAHIIDDIIADRFSDKKAMKWWERLWNWIKAMFTGKSLDSYQSVAEDILNNDTSKLSKDKIRKMKEANLRGEIYYQKDPEKVKLAEKLKSDARSDIQKAVIDAVYLDITEASEESRKQVDALGVHPPSIKELEPVAHVYIDPKTGEQSESVTQKSQGRFPEDKAIKYKPAADAGTSCHKILEMVASGKSAEDLMKEKLDVEFVNDAIKGYFITECFNIVNEMKENGAIVLPEVIISDDISKTAGSQDLRSISVQGFGRIGDLKTSIRTVYKADGSKELSSTYISMWEQSPGSVFNNYVGDDKGIAVLDDEGKLIPRTPKTDANGEVVKDNEGNTLYNEPPVKLSKELSHDVQIGSYAKMNELAGLPIVGGTIYPFQIDLQETADKTYLIKSIRRESNRQVNLENNQPYVDAVVPTPIDHNHPSKLQENRTGYDYTKEPEYDDSVDVENLRKQSQKIYNAELDKSVRAADIAKEVVKAIGQRIQYIESLNSTQQVPIIHQKTVIELNNMKQDFMKCLDKKKYSSILNKWMEYTIKQSATTSTYLNDPTNLGCDEFTAIAAQARKFIQSYAYINELVDQVHGTQITKFNEAVGAVNDLRKALENSIRQWFEFHGKAADTKYLEQEIDEYINGNPKDINIFTRLFAAPSATSSIPVSLAFKEISDAVFKWNEAHDEFKTEVKHIAGTLHKALGIKGYKENIYDFMTHKENAEFVRREDPAQLKMEREAWKALLDDNGEKKQWRLGDSPEDLEYNINLQEDLIHYSDLLSVEKYVPAEYLEGALFSEATIEPGEYYEYKPVPIYDENGKVTGYDDFEAKRNDFEELINGKWVIKFSPDAVQGLRWTKVDGKYYEENSDGTKGRLLTDNERKGLAALEYRYKYYTPYEKSEYKPIYKNGVFTGKVGPRAEDDKIGWRVKPQYKSMRDKSVSGKDLRDPKYITMVSDQTPQGRAKWQFYNDFMSKWEELYRKMPSNRVEQIKGKMPVQSSTLWRQIMDSDTPQAKMSLLGDQFSNMFSSTYVGERMVDEAGNIRQSIPIGFSGSLRDQEAIDRKKAEIAILDTKWKQVKDTATKQQVAEYKKQRDLLNAELSTEEARIMPYQVEKDIVKSLIDTANKIEAYDQLSKIENNVLMIREMAALKSEKNELAKTDANGRSLFKKVVNELGVSLKRALTSGGAGSNELQRIDDMIAMLLYKSEEYPGSFWAKIEQLPITLSAINLFLINPPVSMGVHIMMNSIHLKEAAVGQFFNMKNYGKAKVEVNKAIPAYIQNSAIQSVGGEGKRYGSYPEAWVAKTQAFTKGISDDSGGIKDVLKVEHYVEWTGVATGAIAIAYHTPITGEDGTISNMYDIFTQKPDGSLMVKPNYEKAWNKVKFSFNRTMADYQNRFHGAYTTLERAAITQYPGGKSIMFLHKWIPASMWSMWAPRSVHSNLGVTEGQIVTLINGIKNLKDYEGDIMKKFQTGYRSMVPKGAVGNPMWDNLSPEQKEQADRKAYEDDPNFRKADGSFDEKKAQRDRDTRKLELSNMNRNLVTLVYLMMATASYMLLKALAEDTDDDNTRRWSNFLAKSFDRLRRQQLFAIPVVGMQEEYSLLKSPIASLRIMGEYADALAATFSLPIPPYGANYYTTGVHKGELKAKVKWEAVTPGANLFKWYKEQNNPNYWIR